MRGCGCKVGTAAPRAAVSIARALPAGLAPAALAAATAVAATAAVVAAPAPAPAAAAPAITTATAEATGALGPRTGFVDREITSAELEVVELVDRLLCVIVVRHFDEREA